MSEWWVNALWSIIPTLFAGLFFWLLLRLILRADRTERREYERIKDEERQKLGQGQPES